MQELISIMLIGVSLSMDTFSLSLSLGPLLEKSNYFNIIPLMVGIFHFFMPIIGNYLGIKLITILKITSNTLLGIILIILGINLILSYFNKKEVTIKLNIINMLLLALSVSIDSFSVGLGISEVTNNFFYAATLFAICSFVFTYLGLIIGKYSHKIIGDYASLLGIILLFIIGIYHLLY